MDKKSDFNKMKILGIAPIAITPESIYGAMLGFTIILLVLYNLSMRIYSFLSTSAFISCHVRPTLLSPVIYARSYWCSLRCGSTSRAHLILTFLHLTGTGICNIVQVYSIEDVGKRAAKLSLINLIPMFLGVGYVSGARLLGITLDSYGFIHRSFAMVASVEAVIHVIIVAQKITVSTTNESRFYGLLVGISDLTKRVSMLKIV